MTTLHSVQLDASESSMEPLYVGTDRRAERRRNQTNQDFEKLLRDFGLDRRQRVERRHQHSSWLLLSDQPAS
jgi:hypothetical protein